MLGIFLADQSWRKQMMRKSWLMCVLLGTLAWGQAVPGSPAPPQPTQTPADTSAAVPPTAAVITVKGVCSPQPKPAAAKGVAAKPATAATSPAEKSPATDCKTVITMSDAAKKQGLDKTPQFEETLKFAKMQILANELQRNVQEQAGKIPPEEIAKTYTEH